jgi:thiamine-phosphate pyrophosphorylase
MLAGEAGADYVMFGDPDRRGGRPPIDAIAEQLTWWSELVEIPCVGYAGSRDEIAPLKQAGADFIALGEWLWMQDEKPAAAVTAVSALLAEPASHG